MKYSCCWTRGKISDSDLRHGQVSNSSVSSRDIDHEQYHAVRSTSDDPALLYGHEDSNEDRKNPIGVGGVQWCTQDFILVPAIYTSFVILEPDV